MRTFATICALSLFIIGCALVRTHQDSFVSLHGLVRQTLAGSCDCGPIITNGIGGGRYFEVNPQETEIIDGRLKIYPEPRGLEITVSERQFFSQKEWDRRYAFATNSMSQYMELARTNHLTTNQIDAKTAQRIMGLATNALGLFDLPEWHYQDIGVDVGVQEVDVVYPGLERENSEAQIRYGKIVRLLKPYHRANTALEPTATTP